MYVCMNVYMYICMGTCVRIFCHFYRKEILIFFISMDNICYIKDTIKRFFTL